MGSEVVLGLLIAQAGMIACVGCFLGQKSGGQNPRSAFLGSLYALCPSPRSRRCPI